MSLLLKPDTVALYASSSPPDEHGWVEPPDLTVAPLWSGRANVQLSTGATQVDAASGLGVAEGGGKGPFDPASTKLGTVYLPPEVQATDGDVLVSAGINYVLRGTHYVADPTASDSACLVATLFQAHEEDP